MIETAIFESVIKVIDRLTELLKYRQSKRKEFFITVIEPLFNDLLVMHADYMKMFDDCWHQLLDNKIPLEEIAETLRQRRQVYEGLRIKSRSIVDGLENSDLEPELKNFLKAAAYHLPDGELGPVMSTYAGLVLSRIYSVKDKLIDVSHISGNSPTGDRKIVLDLVIETANHIRQRWGWICEEYVRVKLWALR